MELSSSQPTKPWATRVGLSNQAFLGYIKGLIQKLGCNLVQSPNDSVKESPRCYYFVEDVKSHSWLVSFFTRSLANSNSHILLLRVIARLSDFC